MAETTFQPSYRRIRRIAGRGPEAGQFAEALRAIALDGDERVYAVGDAAVKVFDERGALVRRWPTGRPGYSVAVGRDRRVWVGQRGQVEIYDADGALVDTWRDPDVPGPITAIAFLEDDVFLADASSRCIHRFDKRRVLRNRIGDRHRSGGFNIPNGIVDFAIDGEGVIHVANPGMHRVERYAADGETLGRFGRFDGRDPAGFPGCCNPTNLALDGAGRVVVSEKAGPRVKIYDGEGRLLAVVADEGFDPNAKNMDLAVASTGRIYVADTAALEIHVLAPAPRETTR